MAAPAALGLNAPTIKIYRLLGSGFLAVTALTDTPVGMKPVLSLRQHQKADAAFLVGLSLLSFASFIRHDKSALRFHLGFLAGGITHYLLTNYQATTGLVAK